VQRKIKYNGAHWNSERGLQTLDLFILSRRQSLFLWLHLLPAEQHRRELHFGCIILLLRLCLVLYGTLANPQQLLCHSNFKIFAFKNLLQHVIDNLDAHIAIFIWTVVHKNALIYIVLMCSN
jgi:hypothetical protein